MKPVPRRVAFEHRALWGENVHPERPWWRVTTSAPAGRARSKWVRVDGREGPAFTDPVADVKALQTLDLQYPMPAPAPRAGQVWTWIENDPAGMMRVGDQAQVVSVFQGRAVIVIDGGQAPGFAMPNQWPLPGAALTSGPSVYGMNAPWSGP